MKNCKHIIILTAVSLALTACQNMKGRDFIASLFSDPEPEQVEQSTDPNGQTSGNTLTTSPYPILTATPSPFLKRHANTRSQSLISGPAGAGLA